jgi:hypothetical protein
VLAAAAWDRSRVLAFLGWQLPISTLMGTALGARVCSGMFCKTREWLLRVVAKL